MNPAYNTYPQQVNSAGINPRGIPSQQQQLQPQSNGNYPPSPSPPRNAPQAYAGNAMPGGPMRPGTGLTAQAMSGGGLGRRPSPPPQQQPPQYHSNPLSVPRSPAKMNAFGGPSSNSLHASPAHQMPGGMARGPGPGPQNALRQGGGNIAQRDGLHIQQSNQHLPRGHPIQQHVTRSQPSTPSGISQTAMFGTPPFRPQGVPMGGARVPPSPQSARSNQGSPAVRQMAGQTQSFNQMNSQPNLQNQNTGGTNTFQGQARQSQIGAQGPAAFAAGRGPVGRPNGPPAMGGIMVSNTNPQLNAQMRGPPTGYPIRGPPGPIQMQGPPAVGQIQGPPVGNTFRGPPLGGQMNGPPVGGQLSGPPAGGQLNGQPVGGQMNGPPVGGQMKGPLVGGQLNGPPVGGQLNGPPAGGHMNGPPMSGQMSRPMGAPPAPGQLQHPGPASVYPPSNMPQQQPMQQQPMQQQPKPRIDPNQIPRPVVSSNRIQYIAHGHTVTMPPPASSDYVCIDEGTCNPRFIRPTLNHIPRTKDIWKQCGIPMAVVVCPLADLHEDELPTPLVDFGPNGPLRCTRCAAYVNTFTKFIQGGRKFVCNICTLSNETPRDYYCSVDQNNVRRDVQERAELSRGSVDYVVPAAYTIRDPQEPIFAFLLDVSMSSFECGLIQAALDAIIYNLPSLAQNKRKKVGIITFDSTVHYYRMNQTNSSTPASGISMCVCPDIDDPAAPLPPSSWLVSMEDPTASDKIRELAALILSTFKNTTVSHSVSGSALTSVIDGLSVSGGRAILLHAGSPRIGYGKIRREESSAAYGTTNEVDFYTPTVERGGMENIYAKLAVRCAECHISLDVFSVANTFSSLADIGQVCEMTGGRVVYMPQFEKEKISNAHHLKSSIQRIVDRDAGYEAVLKVRVSAGLRVEKTYGNFYAPNAINAPDEMQFAVIDQDRSVCVELAHDEPLADGSDVYIQAALLYTRSDGIRCVRVHNLALPVDPLLSNVFRFADLDATCSVWQRMCAKKFVDKNLMRSTPSAVKDHLIDECVSVLYNYRKYCASSSSSGQLILPESLKLLPLYTLATLKSRALRGNVTGNPPRGFIDVRADERVMMMGLLNSLPVEFAVSAVYPKLYSIHDLKEEYCTFDEEGKFRLPLQLPPTAEHLDETGVFLLHSAMACYIYIGPRVSPEILLDFFGVEHVDSSESTVDIFEKLPFESEKAGEDGVPSLRERVRDLVEYLNSTIPISQPLEILTKNDWRANRFMSALMEDRTRNDVSYVEFLCQVHKKIQYKFQ